MCSDIRRFGIMVGVLFTIGYAGNVFAETATAAKPSTNTPKTKSIQDPALLENAVKLYEQRLQNGSAAALNQIASAFYTLGEVQEKKTKGHRTDEDRTRITSYYKKASDYFCKAAKAGCEEAVYNAGLALSKIKNYNDAASYYRQCMHKDEKSELALKSAVNLAVLILKKHVKTEDAELQKLIRIGEQNTGKRSETLLQTTMIILTDMNTDNEDEGGVKKGSKETSQSGNIVATSFSATK